MLASLCSSSGDKIGGIPTIKKKHRKSAVNQKTNNRTFQHSMPLLLLQRHSPGQQALRCGNHKIKPKEIITKSSMKLLLEGLAAVTPLHNPRIIQTAFSANKRSIRKISAHNEFKAHLTAEKSARLTGQSRDKEIAKRS